MHTPLNMLYLQSHVAVPHTCRGEGKGYEEFVLPHSYTGICNDLTEISRKRSEWQNPDQNISSDGRQKGFYPFSTGKVKCIVRK